MSNWHSNAKPATGNTVAVNTVASTVFHPAEAILAANPPHENATSSKWGEMNSAVPMSEQMWLKPKAAWRDRQPS